MLFKRKAPRKLPRQTGTKGTHPTHPQTNTQWVYVGFSETAPDYHLWQCVAQPEQPANPRKVKQFNPDRFSPESKAGKGGCSMRWCPGDAVAMDEDEKKQLRAYCETHVERLTLSYIECGETMVMMCIGILKLDKNRPEELIRNCTICGERAA